MEAIANTENVKFLAGGTNLVDLMRADIEHPHTVVDVTALPLADVTELPNGGLRIGATVRNSHLAAHPLVRTRYPVLTQAILAGASGQLRNMATVGGNCCNAPDATTSTTRRQRATNAPQAQAAQR